MKIRPVVVEDFEELTNLYVSYGLPQTTLGLASSDGLVVVDPHSDTIVGAAFLYRTNSPLSLLDLFVVSKDLDKSTRSQVIDLLLTTICWISVAMGFRCIMAEPRFKASIPRLKKHGFKELSPGKFWLEF